MAEKLHIIPHQHAISKEDRERQNRHKVHVLWFTGLSGNGNSTVASTVERELHQQGIRTFILDGNNVRAGLNSDLDFSASSREENIRRIAHESALMKDTGLVVLSAFVSPYQKDHDFAAKLNVQDVRFIPMSDLHGDNVVTRSENMGWYEGGTLLHNLESVHISSDHNLRDCRFPVQTVIRPHSDEYHDFRGNAGGLQVVSSKGR